MVASAAVFWDFFSKIDGGPVAVTISGFITEDAGFETGFLWGSRLVGQRTKYDRL